MQAQIWIVSPRLGIIFQSSTSYNILRLCGVVVGMIIPFERCGALIAGLVFQPPIDRFFNPGTES